MTEKFQQDRMEMTPLEHFNKWFQEELKLTSVRIPTACCLYTIGTDNFPNARFVSLKDAMENKFIVTGTITAETVAQRTDNPVIR